MIRSLILLGAVSLALSACAADPYDPEPTSSYQWQQRQERIERREAARAAVCQAHPDHADCPVAGDPH